MDRNPIARDIYERAVAKMEEDGVDAELRENYSGRGMYGAEVPAIVRDKLNGAMVGIYVALAARELAGDGDIDMHENEFEDRVKEIAPSRQDSMGLGSVFY